MVSDLSRERVPALLLVLLAVALVVGAGWLVYADLRPTYRLTATAVDDVPDDATVIAYDSLSSESRAAFDQARDGAYVVHHDPAFRGSFPLYDRVYVRADGTVYEMWATSDGLTGTSLLVAVPMVAFAVALAAVGGRSFRRRETRQPLTVLAGFGGAALAAALLPARGPVVVGRIPVVASVVAFAVVSTAAWVGLDRFDAA